MKSSQRLLYLLFALILFTTTKSDAQLVDKSSPWSYGVNTYYGAIFRYIRDQPKVNFTGLHGIELYAQKATDGSKRWERMYNQPNVGFSLSYFNYGDPEVLGKVVSATAHLDLTLINGKTNQLRFNIGTGMVYSSRRYHIENNPLNTAISSRISYVLRGTFHYEIKLSEFQYMNINAGFRHFSNGKLNMPNNGMNFPVVGIGLRYAPRPKTIPLMKDENTVYDKKIHFNAMTSIAWREVLEKDTKHKVATLSVYASKQMSKYNALLAGVDGFYYDDDNILKAIEDPQVPDDMIIDGRQLAITFGNELNLGKLWIITQAGIYIYMPAKLYSSWYQRYGLKYYLSDSFFLNTSLKTHSRRANMVEFGLGVKL